MDDRNFDRLKELLADDQIDEALKLLPALNEKRARTASDFIALAKAYGKKGDFPKAEKFFKKAYRIRPSKLMYHDVMDVCLETGHIRDAEEYLREYAALPMRDDFSYEVYRYRILKRKDADRSEVIEALRAINEVEYTEKWAYELAKQYHKAGMGSACREECEKIVRTFDMSPVASKAALLLAYYNGEVSADEIKKSVSPRTRRMGEEVLEAEEMAHPNEENPNDPETTEVGTAIFTEPSPDDAAADIMAAEANYGLEDIARGVCDIIEEENAEPGIEEITAEHSDPEIEEITAEHSDPEIEEITAEHSDPEIEEIVAEHSEEEGPKYGPESFGLISPEEEPDDEDEKREADDEADISKEIRSKTSLEESFLRELNSKRFERTMPQYVLYSPRMNYSASEIKEGKLRSLLVENKVDLESIYRNFFRIDDLRRSLIKSLDLAVNERDALCFVFTGEEQSGKSTLALKTIHVLNEIGVLKYEKTAKIKGEKLNEVDLRGRADALSDCNILVEEAGILNKETLEMLVELFGQKNNGGCLILEDSIKEISSLFRANEEFNGKFNNRVHIPKYGPDELMGFAYDIFSDESYALEASAADNLRRTIIKKTTGFVPRLPVVLELAERAVENADKRFAPEILKMAAEAAIENYNLVILDKDLKP
ncbi:MAG: hypothetical protein IJS80_01405 [Lachnospiraceae bacterium]|nr:hypothetical protein [Lachnospiraceae bacterium]